MHVLDRALAGKVLKRSPLIADESALPLNRRQARLLLVVRWGEHGLVLKEWETSLGIPCAVEYSVVPWDQLAALRQRLPSLRHWFEKVEALAGVPATRALVDSAEPSRDGSRSAPTSLSVADQVWNRAAVESGGDAPGPGDSALAALLVAHGLVTDGGVHHALEVLSPHELSAAADGYAYFGLDDVAAFLRGAHGDPLLSERDDSTVATANRRHAEMVPSDRRLTRAFDHEFANCPEQFAPIPFGDDGL